MVYLSQQQRTIRFSSLIPSINIWETRLSNNYAQGSDFLHITSMIHLIDPLRQLGCTDQLHPSPGRSCEAFLSNKLGGMMALDIIQAIGLMTDVFGRERAVRLLGRFFIIGQELTGHLFEDPDLQKSFRLAFSPSVMNEQSVTAPSVTTLSGISGRSTTSTDTVSRQIDHPSTYLDRGRRGRPRNYRRGRRRHHDSTSSTQSTSTASAPEKKGVRCEWAGCERHVPFSTPRGLREHYMLKHETPSKQAHDKAKAAFETANKFTQRAPFLEVPGMPCDSHNDGDSRSGHIDFEGIGYQFSAASAPDRNPLSMPLTSPEGSITFQSLPPYGSVSSLNFSLYDHGVASSFDTGSLGFDLVDQPDLSLNVNSVSILAERDYPTLFGEINSDNAVNVAGFYANFDRHDLVTRCASPTYDSSS
ncbi:hypothetical protein BDV97DRAFT_42504 [Delphinella strobiligena]|nr:hypothetical protein BDV97DRAFT_42504 [Delphinella strobiligena]